MLDGAHFAARPPVQDLERARAFYSQMAWEVDERRAAPSSGHDKRVRTDLCSFISSISQWSHRGRTRVFSTPRPLLGYGPASASSSHEANDVEQRRTRWKPMSARFAA
jgi:hypothetical protein